MKKLSFVIPAFNEETNIPIIYKKISEIFNNEKYNWEIIFINDGSIDDTLNVLENLSNQNKKVKYIDLSRNFGHQAALSAGLMHTTGDAIISLDCDLQDPPELITQMIKKWEDGFDIVYAQRINYRKDNFIKSIFSKLYYSLLKKITDIDIPQNVGDFRLMDKNVLRVINKMPEKSRYLRGMVAWTGFKSTFVNYHRPDRKEGQSGYTFRKLLMLAMSGMVNFSNIPLKMGLYMGIFSIISGFGLLSYQIYDYLINNAYYHLYKWLVVLIFMFIGFIFILMWILGEYIARIYDEVRDRPLFIVKSKKNFNLNN